MQISLYQLLPETFLKTVCLLLEKCYLSALNTIVLTDSEFQEELNRTLWTFAQKKFIPHGSRLDPLPERQPIYITDDKAQLLDPPNRASVLVLIDNSLEPRFYNQILNDRGVDKYSRVIFIAFANDEIKIDNIKSLVSNSTKCEYSFDLFAQSNAGSWVKI